MLLLLLRNSDIAVEPVLPTDAVIGCVAEQHQPHCSSPPFGSCEKMEINDQNQDSDPRLNGQQFERACRHAEQYFDNGLAVCPVRPVLSPVA